MGNNIVLSETELSFAIEGRTTNLRVWKSDDHKSKGIFMRLDKSHAYSCPLKPDKVLYLNKPNEAISKLATFGFPAPLEKEEEIISLIKDMKQRECILW